MTVDENQASTSRMAEAFALAHELHADQKRKGTEVPYISHLMAVASLVQENGGDEDQVIAALLHDGPEDQGGRDPAGLSCRQGPQPRLHCAGLQG